MLGRFRMCVPECQKEYRTLGEKVFGNPHTVTTLRFGIVKRPKFSAANLREVFEDVTARRSELVNQNDFEPKMTFPLKRGVCRTFVTTLKTEPGQKIIAQPYLIRSYNHVRRIKAARRTTGLSSHTGTGPASSRADTGLSGRTDEGRRTLSRRNSTDLKKAQEFEIWQVARAATAAPLYFEPLKIQMPSTQRYLLFKDGGFGDDNNPTKQGLREIKEAYGDKAIGVVVSVGTARVDKPDRNRKLFHFMPTVTELSQMANDPEKIHEEVEEMSQHDDHPFDYYRLNSPGELDVLLDEWKPKHGSPKKESGSVTIEKIQNVFNTWAGTQENIRLLQGCAERLVRRRRARILNESKWERYATGAKFTCRLKDCNTEEEFCDRQQFLDHLRRDHRVIEQGRLERIIEDSRKCWRYQ
ncbi:hypothetical protein MMC30_006777 [Trapelia coarctata]|nr:hypothetical protein [Trapelia coarctata]